jgi:hypothetical protein
MGNSGGEEGKGDERAGQYIAKGMVTKRIKPMMIDRQENLSNWHTDSLGLSRPC